MTTPSQAAFEIAMAASMEKHERGTCQIAWREGEAHGRKQALEAVRKDAAWQPIETAPNDHFPRLFRVNGFVVQGFLDVTYEHWVQQNGRPPCKMIGNPAHWMPLPKPPIAIKELFT